MIKKYLAKTLSCIFISALVIMAFIFISIYYVTIFPFMWALNYGLTEKQKAGFL